MYLKNNMNRNRIIQFSIFFGRNQGKNPKHLSPSSNATFSSWLTYSYGRILFARLHNNGQPYLKDSWEHKFYIKLYSIVERTFYLLSEVLGSSFACVALEKSFGMFGLSFSSVKWKLTLDDFYGTFLEKFYRFILEGKGGVGSGRHHPYTSDPLQENTKNMRAIHSLTWVWEWHNIK